MSVFIHQHSTYLLCNQVYSYKDFCKQYLSIKPLKEKYQGATEIFQKSYHKTLSGESDCEKSLTTGEFETHQIASSFTCPANNHCNAWIIWTRVVLSSRRRIRYRTIGYDLICGLLLCDPHIISRACSLEARRSRTTIVRRLRQHKLFQGASEPGKLFMLFPALLTNNLNPGGDSILIQRLFGGKKIFSRFKPTACWNVVVYRVAGVTHPPRSGGAIQDRRYS
ncbi:unnamed protein product [Clavelina lepadiformis]|uniref:Uncharacterized protein n=1 Tax=Clavelina lepadiformis TaxID=159417 RepID=A0ABP0GWT5_CLALP